MRKLDGEQVLMRIFVGESDRWEHRPPGPTRWCTPPMRGGLITLERVRVLKYEHTETG